MCIRDRYQRRVRGAIQHNTWAIATPTPLAPQPDGRNSVRSSQTRQPIGCTQRAWISRPSFKKTPLRTLVARNSLLESSYGVLLALIPFIAVRLTPSQFEIWKYDQNRLKRWGTQPLVVIPYFNLDRWAYSNEGFVMYEMCSCVDRRSREMTIKTGKYELRTTQGAAIADALQTACGAMESDLTSACNQKEQQKREKDWEQRCNTVTITADVHDVVPKPLSPVFVNLDRAATMSTEIQSLPSPEPATCANARDTRQAA
eukprot:TRINITY_DN1211_c0_g1_i1.p1 TRINITY_DN1211_c0_g1~~TRINITY_DN1211_c0_g1_i1.p1  ORF type:complete len:258 (-),score=34.75 TRINITY_DN1211_c0_g1_i1:97-870(-)